MLLFAASAALALAVRGAAAQCSAPSGTTIAPPIAAGGLTPPCSAARRIASCTGQGADAVMTFVATNTGGVSGNDVWGFMVTSGGSCDNNAPCSADFDVLTSISNDNSNFYAPTPLVCGDTPCCVWAFCLNSVYSCSYTYAFSVLPPSATPSPSASPSITPSASASLSNGVTPSQTPTRTQSSSATPTARAAPDPTPGSTSEGACVFSGSATIGASGLGGPMQRLSLGTCLMTGATVSNPFRQNLVLTVTNNPTQGDRVSVYSFTTADRCDNFLSGGPPNLYRPDCSSVLQSTQTRYSCSDVPISGERVCVIAMCSNTVLPCTISYSWSVSTPARGGSDNASNITIVGAAIGGVVALCCALLGAAFRCGVRVYDFCCCVNGRRVVVVEAFPGKKSTGGVSVGADIYVNPLEY